MNTEKVTKSPKNDLSEQNCKICYTHTHASSKQPNPHFLIF